MNESRAPAPLYVDAFGLCEWLLGHFGDDARILPRTIGRCGLALLEAITLALKGRQRDEQLERADEYLIRLRTQLRLAGAMFFMRCWPAACGITGLST